MTKVQRRAFNQMSLEFNEIIITFNWTYGQPAKHLLQTYSWIPPYTPPGGKLTGLCQSRLTRLIKNLLIHTLGMKYRYSNEVFEVFLLSPQFLSYLFPLTLSVVVAVLVSLRYLSSWLKQVVFVFIHVKSSSSHRREAIVVKRFVLEAVDNQACCI